MTLWLHIGLPKTGSSALQVFFARNHAVMKQKGLTYPWPGPARRGASTAGNCRWLAEHLGGYPENDERAEQLSQWLRRGRSILLSSEQFAIKGDPVTLKALRDKAGDAKILVYLRDQSEMILGRYLQLKGYGRIPEGRNFTTYAHGGAAVLNDDPPDHLVFDTYLDKIEAMFGRENMTVLSYKQSKRALPESAISAFGMTMDGFDVELPPVNKSPPLEQPDPAVLEEIKTKMRPSNERAVAKWFPGQAYDEVL